MSAAPGVADVTPTPALNRKMVKLNGALPMGLAALLRFVALATFVTLSALGSYRASDEASLRDTARALAAAVDAKLGAYVAALETLATSPLLDGDLDPEAFEARARPVGALLGGTIALLGPGPEYAVLVTTGRRPNSPLSDALQMALSATIGAGEPGFSDLFEGPAVPRPLLAAAVPVDRVGQPRRGLALTFEPATLRALLARQTFSSGTFAAVADGQMRILAHSADPEGRLVGVPAPEWVAPGWSGLDNVHAVERLTRAPDWAVGVYERRAAQQASAWAALRWLIAGGAALGLGLAIVVWASRREAVRDARREAEAMRAGRAEVERLLGGLPAAIFLREVAADGSSRLVYRGGNLETVMGWPTAELATRRNLEGLIHPEDTTLTRQMPQLLREGQVSYEWRMRQPAGGWRTLNTLARVLARRPDGGAEIVGYTVDVTAQRQAESRAEAAQRELEQMLQYAPVVVFRGRVWPDGSCSRSYISPAIERMTGWPMNRVSGPGQLSQLFAPEDRAGAPDDMRGLVRNGSAACDRRLQHADGRWLLVRMQASVIDRYEDESVDAVGYILDVTAEREAQARAINSTRLASLGEMAAGLAHEMKQPLQAISLAAEIAQIASHQGNAATVDERLNTIVEQAGRTADMIDHLRRFARGAEQDAAPEAVPLEAAIRGSLGLAGAALYEAGITVELALGDPSPIVRGQLMLLEQVLTNLLLNARDAVASRPAGMPRRVRIAAALGAEGTVHLTLADTGGGIAPEVMGRLFEPFVTTKGPDKGTGLGLSLTCSLIKGMGGTIEAHNDTDGAVFVITLPSA
jgi:PAS domain S-box-containing protein